MTTNMVLDIKRANKRELPRKGDSFCFGFYFALAMKYNSNR